MICFFKILMFYLISMLWFPCQLVAPCPAILYSFLTVRLISICHCKVRIFELLPRPSAESLLSFVFPVRDKCL